MSNPRLSLALGEGGLRLPDAGIVAVIDPRAEFDLGPLVEAVGQERIEVVQRMKPDHDHFVRSGFRCETRIGGPYAAALVCLPRAKALAREQVGRAFAAVEGDGPVIVDGQKTEGIDSILKELRARTAVSGPWSKAHGKIFGCDAGAELADWVPAPGAGRTPEGYVTLPGVFSADGVDPGSAMLAEALPRKLGAEVADLGAGWGYLAARTLVAHEGIATLHLVEADEAALACARENVRDARAAFHWADATRWGEAGTLDAVIMNPPFHSGRAADPNLGRAFIENAARLLKPSGKLWMVANRHLPYESALAACFAATEEAGGDGRFKILRAERPARQRR